MMVSQLKRNKDLQLADDDSCNSYCILRALRITNNAIENPFVPSKVVMRRSRV
jgi:hypothetical protein